MSEQDEPAEVQEAEALPNPKEQSPSEHVTNRPPQSRKGDGESSVLAKDKISLALIVSILSFLGAIGGTFVSSKYQRTQWAREARHAYQQAILNKRVELLDRTASILNRGRSAERLDLYARSTLLNAEGSLDKRIERVLDPLLKRDELDVEFATAMNLDRVYFGPKTQLAIDNITKVGPDWWKADEATNKALLNALAEELTLGVTPLPPD